jgi:hypothetical protein
MDALKLVHPDYPISIMSMKYDLGICVTYYWKRIISLFLLQGACVIFFFKKATYLSNNVETLFRDSNLVG